MGEGYMQGTRNNMGSRFRNSLKALEDSGVDSVNDTILTKKDFQNMLLSQKGLEIIYELGVDGLGLLDMADVIFEDCEKHGAEGLRFADLTQIVLNMRATNQATVKDVNTQMRVMKGIVCESAGTVLQ